MKETFLLPTKVYSGRDCVRKNPGIFERMGKRALIVTGRNSARLCGALADVTEVLDRIHAAYVIFDEIEPNPTIDIVYKGADVAVQNKADFIVAIGGGSPMDAAKSIAVLACEQVAREDIFKGGFTHALPMIHIPTTAGTGSEVTPYAILTNDAVESKMTMSSPVMFPEIAFLDGKYMEKLSYNTTVNTAVDALSHAVEGMLSKKSSCFSDALAKQSIAMIASHFEDLRTGNLSAFARQDLLEASALAGMVISQVGTTVVHTMGYSFTYFLGTDHGRSNGLNLGSFLMLGEAQCPDRIKEILACMDMQTVEELKAYLDGLLKPYEVLTDTQISHFSNITMKLAAKKLADCVIAVEKNDIINMYAEYRQGGKV